MPWPAATKGVFVPMRYGTSPTWHVNGVDVAPNAAQYAALLKEAYRRIKQADPNAMVNQR